MLDGIKIASNLREDKTMKKLMVILLSGLMCLSLYGCQGVADAGDILFDPIRDTIARRAMPIQASSVEIVHAELGNTAGVIGASLLIES